MMVNTMDMSAPVTRGELREELDRAFEQRLAPFATKAELAHFATKADLEPLVTKEYLEERLEPLVTKEYLEDRLKAMASKEDLETWGGGLLERLRKDLREGLKAGLQVGLEELREALRGDFAKHVQTMEETFQRQVSAFDDKYEKLPGRVERLEGAVFPDDKSEKPDKTSGDKAAAKPESKKARQAMRSTVTARSPKRR